MKIFKASLALIFAVASVFSAGPAVAHDGVVSTSPANQSTVAADLITVSVTFGEKILDLNKGQGLAIEVVSPSATKVTSSCISINGETMSVDVDIDEPGTYQVAWQSVSTDGHTNTGNFSFVLTNEDGYQAGELPTCEPIPSDSVEPMVISTPPADEPSESAAPDSTQTWLYLGLVVVLTALVGAIIYSRRRNLKGKSKSDTD